MICLNDSLIMVIIPSTCLSSRPHYQIHMMIDAEWDLRNDESGQNKEWIWKFPGSKDKENKWNQYCKGVQNKW